MGDQKEDQKILDQMKDNFSCKICDGVLICTKTLNCGHKFCTYCLDLLQPISKQCPQCDACILSKVKSPETDKEIEILFISSSPELQKTRETAMLSRTKRDQERPKQFTGVKKNFPKGNGGAKSAKNLEEICANVASNIGAIGSILLATEPKTPQLKTDKTSRVTKASNKAQMNSTANTIQTKKTPKPRSKTGLKAVKSLVNSECAMGAKVGDEIPGIDILKVEELFNMYDIFLQSDIGQGGFGDNSGNDTALVNPLTTDVEIQNESAEIQRLRRKHKSEVELLLMEAERAIKLDEFIKKWAEQLKKVVNVDTKTDKPIVNKCIGDIKNSEAENLQASDAEDVNDDEEMWKISAELIREFRDSKQAIGPQTTKDALMKDFPLLFEDGDADYLEDFITPRCDGNENREDNTGDVETASSTDRINVQEMGEAVLDENAAFQKKVKDCKKVLTQLKETQSTKNPTAILNITKPQVNISGLPATTLKAARMGIPKNSNPNPTAKDRQSIGQRPSTVNQRTTTLPPIPFTSRGKSRPTSAMLDKRPPFQ